MRERTRVAGLRNVLHNEALHLGQLQGQSCESLVCHLTRTLHLDLQQPAAGAFGDLGEQAVGDAVPGEGDLRVACGGRTRMQLSPKAMGRARAGPLDPPRAAGVSSWPTTSGAALFPLRATRRRTYEQARGGQEDVLLGSSRQAAEALDGRLAGEGVV